MYRPPQYIIAINIYTVPESEEGKTEVSRVWTARFYYNYDIRKMYIDRNPNYGNWRYIDPKGCWADTGIIMPAGEKAFELAYGIEFYHLH